MAHLAGFAGFIAAGVVLWSLITAQWGRAVWAFGVVLLCGLVLWIYERIIFR